MENEIIFSAAGFVIAHVAAIALMGAAFYKILRSEGALQSGGRYGNALQARSISVRRRW